ncbi:MAG: hypothetical protein HYR64_09205 [Fimbriimonas ginsengisoli]|uniref:Glycoside hydrolase family 57 N-terminal domain-containing protein n=1 Tax=Fimbriimonas ginsengisoli TaxID=1005039 RepID=A0A931LW14_FIMGI|nr:hypothetical protein [Fimbriimonas ginsengisoli]
MKRGRLTLLATLLATLTANAQTPPAWQVNERHDLVWDGAPYRPIGVRIAGLPAQIEEARSLGFHDVVVELPASGDGWADAFAALEKGRMRYLISLNSLAPMAQGFAVEPQGYRIEGITERRDVSLKIEGAQSVFAVLVTRKDSAVEKAVRVPTPGGQFSLRIEPMNDLEHVLLLYPEMASLEAPDLWGGLDAHRDRLLRALRVNPPGKGLRAILNPLGSVVRLPGKDLRFVPSSPFFQFELRAFLESKYRSMDTALRAWSLSSSDIDSFEKLARLVPLWSASRGISHLWDPATDKTYLCDSTRSTAWVDIEATVSLAAAERYRSLVSSLRSASGVPILQEWAGWSIATEDRRAGLDGVAIRTHGPAPSAVAEGASRGVSSALRWAKESWLPATELTLSGIDAEARLPAILEELASMGVRGWFLKSDDESLLRAWAAYVGRSSDPLLSADPPRPLYFPESATNPAIAQRLPGGVWWLPSPADGNRIDLGTQFHAYRLQDPTEPQVVLWTDGPSRRVLLKVVEPKNLRAETLDASDPKAKLTKAGFEVNISQLPLILRGIDEIPVPLPAFEETVARFDQMLKSAEAISQDAAEDRLFFRDNVSGFERNPGGSFNLLRLQYDQLSLRLANYSWAEAEASPLTNFSEPSLVPGCSGGGALVLRTRIGQTYFAEFNLRVRSPESQEVWLAARLPDGLRGSIQVLIGGQLLTISGPPISPYGLGFAWYRVGLTKLSGANSKVRIQLSVPNGADLAIDALVLFPGAFRPAGISQPDAIPFPSLDRRAQPGTGSPYP